METSMAKEENAWFIKHPEIDHLGDRSYPAGASLQDIYNSYQQFCRREETLVIDEPWYIAEPQQELSNSLCDVCKHIDFSYIFSGHRGRQTPILWFQNVLENHSRCSFCDLVLTAVRLPNGVEPNLLAFHWTTSSALTIHGYRPQFNGMNMRVLKLIRQDSGTFVPIPPRIADFDRIQRWIMTCERSHHDASERVCYIESSSKPPASYTLHVVDVQEQCIKAVTHDARYVVLSYVWGGVDQMRLLESNYSELTAEGSLAQDKWGTHLSQTIVDAIWLVARLGERYLWVDALCIIQDSPEFGQQIKNMNKIYSQAAWCLVTASASSANDPLPRIGNEQDNLRSPYASRTVQGLQLATKPPPLYELISSSRWGSRAWTYQENVLSQRRLYVTNAQAYFTCRHDSMFSEARGSEHSQRLSEVTYFNKGHVYGKQNVTNFEVYSKAVEEYTTRDMALQEDALKALTGVLSYLQTSFRGSFLYGLPDTEIDQALLWRPRDNAIRRKDRTGRYLFPSWSWAGWIGSVEFEQNLAISRVKWKNPHTGKFFSTESFRRPDSDSIDSCWYRDTWSEEDIHGSIYVSSGGFDENGKMGEMRYLHPVADCASTKDWMFFDIKQRLQFRALFCCFKINRQHDRYASCSRGMHNVCALKIFSFSDNQVGTIHVPGSIAALLQPGAFEFVRLSRTRLNEDDTSHNQFPADYDEFGGLAIPQAHSGQKFEPDYHPNLFQFDTEKFDHTVPWCVYNVMLIETKDGISQRLGIGKVHMDAFLQESPVWKEFILE